MQTHYDSPISVENSKQALSFASEIATASGFPATAAALSSIASFLGPIGIFFSLQSLMGKDVPPWRRGMFLTVPSSTKDHSDAYKHAPWPIVLSVDELHPLFLALNKKGQEDLLSAVDHYTLMTCDTLKNQRTSAGGIATQNGNLLVPPRASSVTSQGLEVAYFIPDGRTGKEEKVLIPISAFVLGGLASLLGAVVYNNFGRWTTKVPGGWTTGPVYSKLFQNRMVDEWRIGYKKYGQDGADAILTATFVAELSSMGIDPIVFCNQKTRDTIKGVFLSQGCRFPVRTGRGDRSSSRPLPQSHPFVRALGRSDIFDYEFISSAYVEEGKVIGSKKDYMTSALTFMLTDSRISSLINPYLAQT